MRQSNRLEVPKIRQSTIKFVEDVVKSAVKSKPVEEEEEAEAEEKVAEEVPNAAGEPEDDLKLSLDEDDDEEEAMAEEAPVEETKAESVHEEKSEGISFLLKFEAYFCKITRQIDLVFHLSMNEWRNLTDFFK